IAGATISSDFPTADQAQQKTPNLNDVDAFVVKLNAGGETNVYSTLLGGSATDQAYAIAVDAGGNAYVAGSTGSSNFPTVEPLQQYKGGLEIFVAKLGAEADLAITMSGSRNSVMVGNPLRYTITVATQGPSPATGVVLTDVLPGQVAL